MAVNVCNLSRFWHCLRVPVIFCIFKGPLLLLWARATITRLFISPCGRHLNIGSTRISWYLHVCDIQYGSRKERRMKGGEGSQGVSCHQTQSWRWHNNALPSWALRKCPLKLSHIKIPLDTYPIKTNRALDTVVRQTISLLIARFHNDCAMQSNVGSRVVLYVSLSKSATSFSHITT